MRARTTVGNRSHEAIEITGNLFAHTLIAHIPAAMFAILHGIQGSSTSPLSTVNWTRIGVLGVQRKG
jgi:hypothetical protein